MYEVVIDWFPCLEMLEFDKLIDKIRLKVRIDIAIIY